LIGGVNPQAINRESLWEPSMELDHTKEDDAIADEMTEAFLNATSAEDDLGFVIRAHIFIEHELRRIIEAAIPNPEHLELDN
jgi:hypothetical protein